MYIACVEIRAQSTVASERRRNVSVYITVPTSAAGKTTVMQPGSSGTPTRGSRSAVAEPLDGRQAWATKKKRNKEKGGLGWVGPRSKCSVLLSVCVQVDTVSFSRVAGTETRSTYHVSSTLPRCPRLLLRGGGLCVPFFFSFFFLSSFFSVGDGDKPCPISIHLIQPLDL